MRLQNYHNSMPMPDVGKLNRVLVFRTNLSHAADIFHVQPLLNSDARIKKWNVDLHDQDNVLRIESPEIDPGEVISMVAQAGYFCEELPD